MLEILRKLRSGSQRGDAEVRLFSDYTIGNTTTYSSPELSARYGAQVFYKDEGENSASHSFKDRRNRQIIKQDSHIERPVRYVHISYGNSARSLGRLCRAFSEETGLDREPITFVPDDLDEETIRELQRYGTVRPIDLNTTILSTESLIHHVGIDGPQNIQYRQVEQIGDGETGYAEIAREITGLEPDYVFVPVGSGELFYALTKAFETSDSTVKVIGGTTENNVNAHDELFMEIDKKGIAYMLECGYSPFKRLIQDAVTQGPHELTVLSDDDIRGEMGFLNDIGIHVDGNSAAAFAAAKKYGDKFKQDDNIVIIKTAGNGSVKGVKPKSSHLRKIGLGAGVPLALIAGTAFGINAYTTTKFEEELQKKEREIEWAKTDQYRTVRDLLGPGNSYYRDVMEFLIDSGDGKINPKAQFILESSRYRGGVDGIVFDSMLKDPENKRIFDSFKEWRRKKHGWK